MFSITRKGELLRYPVSYSRITHWEDHKVLMKDIDEFSNKESAAPSDLEPEEAVIQQETCKEDPSYALNYYGKWDDDRAYFIPEDSNT